MAFIDDGVYQLKKNQDSSATGIKNFSPAYRALGDYDVTRLYVERESLESRGLSEQDLMDLTYEDEDDDWAEKPSIRIVSGEQAGRSHCRTGRHSEFLTTDYSNARPMLHTDQ